MTSSRAVRGAGLGLLCVLQAVAAAAQAPTVELKRRLVVTSSTVLTRKTYRLAAPASLDSAVIVIRGDDITLDLNGATIVGTAPNADPDQAAGVAIRVEGGRNITIKNGTIHGYRVNILARGTNGLTLADLDAGQSWKPRLYSLVEHESIADWLSFHHNEHREWLRYGAGVYLDSVSFGEIRNVRAEQGMNGLMLVNTDHLLIHDNTIQFNSGVGIGLYRSSGNRLVHNRFDYNVRGYSNGFYWRGQDSADLLFFEQSSRNVVAYNSATHGGDGLFLWAGQSTMDSGEGGANDNLFYGNDFSFAPANAMEATFSRNSFVGNRAAGSDYGLWGGYSFESKIVANCFVQNRVGVAIEHGQDDFIASNVFDVRETAIRLWGDKIEPGDWGYPKHRDTQSRNVVVAQNVFVRASIGVSAANTSDLEIRNGHVVALDTLTEFKDTLRVTMDSSAWLPFKADAGGDPCGSFAIVPPDYARLAPQAAGVSTQIPESPLSLRDRSAIIVDEWGPYDWRAPKLWPVDSTRALPLRLAVLGPAGRWTVARRRAIAKLSAASGIMNDTITVTPRADSAGDWELTLESQGKRFSYSRFEPAQKWAVKIFAWNDSTDPRKDSAVFATAPVLEVDAPRLDYEWYKPKLSAIPLEKWALEATSTVTLAPGTYTLRAISDDGVRVWVDGKLAIDDWTAHESTVDAVPLAAGRHELRVRYYQVDGWAELRLDFVRGVQRAGGSPGPH